MADDKSSSPNKNLINFVSGGCAGAVSRTTVAPLERLKILLQLQTGANKQYKGVVSSLVSMYRADGLKGFYMGNGANVIRIFPYSAVQFAVNHKLVEMCTDEHGEGPGTLMRLACGAGAGVASVAATYPLDHVRTHLTVDKKFTSISQGLRVIYGQGGVPALYRGLSPTLIGIAPYVGINFAAYDVMKKTFPPEDGPDGSLTYTQRLVNGAVAGAIAQSCTYPLDVLRRRFHRMPENGVPYKGVLDAFTSIIKNEGVLALYQGMLPNFLKVVPAMAVAFTTFEAVSHSLQSL